MGSYITTPIKLINKMQLPATYAAYSQMRRGFIEPAMKSINERTDLDITLKEERLVPDDKKSKVTHLMFKINKKPGFDKPKI